MKIQFISISIVSMFIVLFIGVQAPKNNDIKEKLTRTRLCENTYTFNCNYPINKV